MENQFLAFQTFNDITVANEMADTLKQNNIACRVEKNKPLLDAVFVGMVITSAFVIKLQATDFLKAHELFAGYYKKEVDHVSKDYYLFDFSNEELKEILSRPDEWGDLDYALAAKILKDRGQEINAETAQQLKDERIVELSQPEKAGKLLLFCGYLLIPLGGVVAIIIGRSLLYNKTILPNGESIYTYRDEDRNHGSRMIAFGVIVILIAIVTKVYTMLFNS